jgi:hypothetical protein
MECHGAVPDDKAHGKVLACSTFEKSPGEKASDLILTGYRQEQLTVTQGHCA